MKKIILLVVVGVALSAAGGRVSAQDNVVKTNAVAWATTSINAAYEAGLTDRTSLEIGASYNPWTFAHNKKFRHLMLQPEYRFWACDRFLRGFWGVHLLGGIYNVGHLKLPFNIYRGTRNHRYEGWFVGAGVSYGYAWYLAPHLNLEATAGVGYVRAYYKRYECGKCGAKMGNGHKNYFGPTKLAISLAYLF
jgi:hypothetical protein